MQKTTNENKRLEQAVKFFWEALKCKGSPMEALERALGRTKSSSNEEFYLNCHKGMSILLSLCGSKFSASYIQNLLPEIFNAIHEGPVNQETMRSSVYGVYESFLTWNTEAAIYFPVESIEVKSESPVTFGRVAFWSFSALQKSKKTHEILKDYCQEIHYWGDIKTVASYSMIGDFVKARESGEVAVKDVLNVMQYAQPVNNAHHQTPHFTLLVESCRTHGITFRESNGEINLDCDFCHGNPLRLFLPFSPACKAQWDDAYGDDAIDMILSSSSCELTKLLQQAIYWHATGERESNKERALIFYTLSLEAVLTSMSQGISTQEQIGDAIAFILGKNVEERLEIKKASKNLYKIRSNLLHGNVGERVLKSQLEIQRYFSQEAIKFVFKHREQLMKKSDIALHFEFLKFSLPKQTISRKS